MVRLLIAILIVVLGGWVLTAPAALAGLSLPATVFTIVGIILIIIGALDIIRWIYARMS